jgi:hypothetical protein
MTFKPSMILAALALAATPAAAQPPPLRLALGYDGRLDYIKVLDLQFQQHITASAFDTGAQLRSYGVLAAFKRFDIQASAEGAVDAQGPRPGAFDYINHDGKRVRHVTAAWRADAVDMTSTPAFSDLGDPPASLDQRLAAADPLTQLTRMTVAAPIRPCEGAPMFFDGKQLYQLAFSGAQAATPDDGQRALGVTRLTRCAMRYVEVAGFKKKPASKRNGGLTSPITITFGQIGAAGPWVIADVRASTPLGPADIVLRQVRISHAGG